MFKGNWANCRKKVCHTCSGGRHLSPSLSTIDSNIWKSVVVEAMLRLQLPSAMLQEHVRCHFRFQWVLGFWCSHARISLSFDPHFMKQAKAYSILPPGCTILSKKTNAYQRHSHKIRGYSLRREQSAVIEKSKTKRKERRRGEWINWLSWASLGIFRVVGTNTVLRILVQVA